jgi:molybdopterin-binding protein
VRWERFFEDLEGQLDSEWEAERAALDTEAERVRLSRIALRERLVALTRMGCTVSVHVAEGTALTGAVAAVGADWLALASDSGPAGVTIVPHGSVSALTVPHADLLASARQATAGSLLRQRMTFGFVLRDLARRRVPVTVHLGGGQALSGTIDRAGADHLDLAVHDPGAPRRADAVRGHRLVSFAAVSWVRPDAPTAMP